MGVVLICVAVLGLQGKKELTIGREMNAMSLRMIESMVCASIVLVKNIYAYLDPSVMTYAIQVVAGVIVAAGAVVGIYWRKAKKKVQDKLGIDENAKKEVEDDVIETVEEEKK